MMNTTSTRWMSGLQNKGGDIDEIKTANWNIYSVAFVGCFFHIYFCGGMDFY